MVEESNGTGEPTMGKRGDMERKEILGGTQEEDRGCDPCGMGAEEKPIVKRVLPCSVYSRVVGYFSRTDNWNRGKKEEFKDRVEFDIAKSLAHPDKRFAAGEVTAALQPAGLFTPDEDETREPGLLGGSDIERREHAAATVGAYRPDGDLRLSA